MTNDGQFTVLAFGSAVEVLGWRERRFPADGRPLAALLDELEQGCAALRAVRGRLKVAINQRYADGSAVPAAGDEVALIPPVAGGDHDGPRPGVVRLTRSVIDVPALVAEVEHAGNGAIATFIGVVRAERDAATGRTLAALDYTAYEAMAQAELERLVEAALAEFPVTAVRVEHRLGRLAIGEASVAVVVAAPHRAASFDACRTLMERLKESVPIFKREIWGDGTHTWVE